MALRPLTLQPFDVGIRPRTMVSTDGVYTIVATTASTHCTVPASARYVRIACSADIWLTTATAAAFSTTGSVVDGSALGELIRASHPPEWRYCSTAQSSGVLAMITGSSQALVSLTFYKD